MKQVAYIAGLWALAASISACQPRSENEPIVVAVGANDTQTVSRYLAEGGDPDYVSREGDPLIYIAAGPRGGEDVAQLLLLAGADISAVSANGRPALHNAAAWCDLDMVRLLLEGGADVTQSGKNGEGVLDAVCKQPQERRSATIALLQSGASAR